MTDILASYFTEKWKQLGVSYQSASSWPLSVCIEDTFPSLQYYGKMPLFLWKTKPTPPTISWVPPLSPGHCTRTILSGIQFCFSCAILPFLSVFNTIRFLTLKQNSTVLTPFSIHHHFSVLSLAKPIERFVYTSFLLFLSFRAAPVTDGVSFKELCQNNTNKLSHIFCRSEIQAQHGWVFYSEDHWDEIQVLARTAVSSGIRVLSQAH